MGERAVGLFAEVDHLGGAVGRRPDAQVVQDRPAATERHIPVVGLMEMEVQAHHAVGACDHAVGLDHLACAGYPLPAEGLHERAALVAEGLQLDDEHSGDAFGGGDGGHVGGCFRLFEIDETVVTQHETGGGGALTRAEHLGVAAQQTVGETGEWQ